MMFFYSYVTGIFITYFLTVIQTQSHTSIEDGTVSLCTDMYTDDYREQSYLDLRVPWIDRQFQKHHAAQAVGHLGTAAHTGDYSPSC